MKRTQLKPLLISALALGVLAGCAPIDEDLPTVASARKVAPYVPTASAGLPVTVSTDPNALKALIARSASFGRSSDPFRLLPNEVQFERSQTAERLFSEQGAFNLEYKEPVPPTGTGLAPEAQPYRRLSGIVIGDAIVGILETQGEPTIIIRPGQLIPGTEWRVVLINEDRAVLRRPGNRQPTEISVNLELPPPGFGTGAADGTGGGSRTGPAKGGGTAAGLGGG